MSRKNRQRSPSKARRGATRTQDRRLIAEQRRLIREILRCSRPVGGQGKPIEPDDKPSYPSTAPVVLISRYERSQDSAYRGLLKRLLTDRQMCPVWERLSEALRGQSDSKQDVAYQGLWGAIQYAYVRHKRPVASRRDLRMAISRLSQGLLQAGQAIAPYLPREGEEKKVWAGVPSWLLWKCLPDDLAAVLEHWAPHMAYVAREANEKAHTALTNARPVDRGGYDWSVFVRLLQEQWPQSLDGLCTHDTLARMTCAVFPESPVTTRMMRDTLRRTPSRRSH